MIAALIFYGLYIAAAATALATIWDYFEGGPA